jgi:hypothetical protein
MSRPVYPTSRPRFGPIPRSGLPCVRRRLLWLMPGAVMLPGSPARRRPNAVVTWSTVSAGTRPRHGPGGEAGCPTTTTDGT